MITTIVLVAALALLFVLVPPIVLQLALRSFAPPADAPQGQEDKEVRRPVEVVPGRPFDLARTTS